MIVDDLAMLVKVDVEKVCHVDTTEVVREHEEVSALLEVRFCRFEVSDCAHLINANP